MEMAINLKLFIEVKKWKQRPPANRLLYSRQLRELRTGRNNLSRIILHSKAKRSKWIQVRAVSECVISPIPRSPQLCRCVRTSKSKCHQVQLALISLPKSSATSKSPTNFHQQVFLNRPKFNRSVHNSLSHRPLTHRKRSQAPSRLIDWCPCRHRKGSWRRRRRRKKRRKRVDLRVAISSCLRNSRLG